MKKAKKPAPASPLKSKISWLGWAVAAALAALVFWAYSPAANGPFLFDDSYMGFALPGADAPLGAWVRGVRPVLMATYWVNHQISGDGTGSFHTANVLIHCICTGLLFLIVKRLLEWAGLEAARRNGLACLAASIFLLHPAQTEAVAYLAGRSEALATMFVFAAFGLFLYREKPALTWLRTGGVMAFFLAALFTKEHTVALPALLLLTDYWWNPGFSFKGIWGNWKLYATGALGAGAGVIYFLPSILHAPSAGFGMRDLTWYQYFFTQCRALFVYPMVFLAPARLTADWDFPVSKTIFERGSIVGLIALVSLVILAWRYRRRFPLATYGFFTYLVLMAPTSSILPIQDPVAERRLYFSMIGLLLILVDFVSRLKITRQKLVGATTLVALAAAFATHARAAVWGDAVALWEDTAAKSPNKPRAHFQLGFAYYDQGNYARAIAEFDRVARLQPPTHNLLIDWGLAYDAMKQPDLAIAKLRQAAEIEATPHVYSQIGMVYAKRGQWPQALDALVTAERLDPNYAPVHFYRGSINLSLNRVEDAVTEYERALALDPALTQAREGLAAARRRLGAK
jgi:protein O-mannosyl-transferase